MFGAPNKTLIEEGTDLQRKSICSLTWFINPSRNKRSSGGYPVSANSGNTIKCAPKSAAPWIKFNIFCAFDSISPTIALNWAIWILIGSISENILLSCSCQNIAFVLLPVLIACSYLVLATTSAGSISRILANNQACVSLKAALPELYLLRFDWLISYFWAIL